MEIVKAFKLLDISLKVSLFWKGQPWKHFQSSETLWFSEIIFAQFVREEDIIQAGFVLVLCQE